MQKHSRCKTQIRSNLNTKQKFSFFLKMNKNYKKNTSLRFKKDNDKVYGNKDPHRHNRKV